MHQQTADLSTMSDVNDDSLTPSDQINLLPCACDFCGMSYLLLLWAILLLIFHIIFRQ